MINDIRNAVNAGKEVTVSKTNITFNGWNGCGYIIIDPVTGAGAYMISSGFSGGQMMYALAFFMLFMALLNLGTCLMGNIPMCSAAAVMASIAMAFMNIAMCLLNASGYFKEPNNELKSIQYNVGASILHGVATGILVTAFKKVPLLGSHAINVFKVQVTAAITSLFSLMSGAICDEEEYSAN